MGANSIVCPESRVAEAKSHNWSDWAGCIFFLGLGVFLVLGMPKGAWMVLPTVFHDVIISMTYLIRRPARRTNSSWAARLIAYLSAFLVPAYLQVADRCWPGSLSLTSPILTKIALAVWTMGVAFEIWTVWQLRFAFSIVPQARVLQTSGPYRLVRHPIYLGYTVIYLAYLMAHMHLTLGLVMLIWLGITLIRIGYEESVLKTTFPEYSAYQAKVGRLFPLPR